MASSTRPRKTKSSNPAFVEWVGGHYPLPGLVTDEVEPYHVEIVVWLELPSDVIVGHDVVRAGDLAGSIGKSLQDSMRKPLVGSPRQPDRVRVGSEAAAAEARAVVGPDTQIVVGATPELDSIGAALQAKARQSLRPPGRKKTPAFGDFTSGSYLQGGLVPPESIEDLFRAAEVLSALAPWRSIQVEQLLRLDIPDLEVHGAALAVMSQQHEGFIIFTDPESFVAMLRDFSLTGGKEPKEPGTALVSLRFLRPEELPEPARGELERFRWSKKLSRYPWVELRERDGSLVPVDRRNIEIVSAVAWTLGTFCAQNQEALVEDSEEAVSVSVETSDRPTVRYTLPYEAFDAFEPQPGSEARPSKVPFPELPLDTKPTSRGRPQADRKAHAGRVSLPESRGLQDIPRPKRVDPARKLGRNEPCPCGSGRKYKHCHLQADGGVAGVPGAAAYSSGQPAGVKMVEILREFADEHFGSSWHRHTRDFRDVAATLQLAREWSVFHFEVDGQTAAAAFTAIMGRLLSNVEKQWLAVQQEAWLSVWEVLSVQRGRGFTARDLLCGEERIVHDVSASESVNPRDTMLARIVQWGNRSEIWGVHPRTLTPLAASHVVDATRKRLGLGSQGLASTEVLRTAATGRFLIRQWERTIERMDEERRNLPRFATTDGETLVTCSVVYDFDPKQRLNVAAALAAMPDTVPPDAGDMRAGRIWNYTFSRLDPRPRGAARGRESRTVLGSAQLGEKELRLETNSRERCERLTGQLSKVAGRLLRERERTDMDVREELSKALNDPAATAKKRLPRPEAVPPPELIDIGRALKRDHYRNWLDESIPALGGKTPRQAARLVRGRRQLDLLLRDMENHESRLPEWDRFDFSELRAELGLDP